MGAELHITRNEFWADDDHPISKEEWLNLIDQDPELELNPENGDTYVEWRGDSLYERPWLDWFQGNISTKWPDTALYQKMLRIAEILEAKVQDDDGTIYPDDAQWDFTPPLES